MSSPYRALPSSSPGAARELVCEWRDLEARAEAGRAAFKVFLGAVLVSALVGFAGLPLGTVVVLFGGAAWAVRRHRAVATTVNAIVFRVENGVVGVTSRAGTPLLQISLRNLLDVEIETTSITRVERDTGLGAAGVGPARPGLKVDVSRVFLVPEEPREPVPLTEAGIPYVDAVALTGKIRTFLRSHGWLPEDEREDPPR